jgi:hypothetical protein
MITHTPLGILGGYTVPKVMAQYVFPNTATMLAFVELHTPMPLIARIGLVALLLLSPILFMGFLYTRSNEWRQKW